MIARVWMNPYQWIEFGRNRGVIYHSTLRRGKNESHKK